MKKGETVRLRLINGSSTYTFRFRIDGHPLTVIATDGMPVRPVTVDDFLLAVGERRFDAAPHVDGAALGSRLSVSGPPASHSDRRAGDGGCFSICGSA